MSVVYPLSFPTVGIVNSTFRLRHVVGESTSIFTGAQQLYRHPGEWWEGEVTFAPTKYTDAGQIKAFLSALRGKFGTFLYGDPDFLARGLIGEVNGTPVVNGTNLAGSGQLGVRGLTPFSNFLLKGDYIQLGSGASARLHILLNDAVVDSSGETLLDIEPRLRSAPSDGDAIVTTGAKSVMRLTANPVEWGADQNSIHSFTISFREALQI